MAQYNWEVYDQSGGFVADLSGLASNRKVKASRNGAGDITFNLDTAQLRQLAESLGKTSQSVLAEGQNEIRVKRTDGNGSVYLRQGGRIELVTDSLESEGVHKNTAVQANGFLDMLTSRYLEKQRAFNNVQVATIIWTVINEMQTASTSFWASTVPTAARATLGLTQGTLDTSIGTKVRTYEAGKSVRDIMTQFTELSTTETDVEVDHLKQVHVYGRMGADKPQVVFELGRNIVDYDIPRDATGLINRAITYGQGTGSVVRVQSIDQDTASQTAYKVRQHVLQMNSVEEEATLSEHGAGRVATSKDPLTVPRITVDLNVDFTVKDFWIGDRVTVRILDPDLGTQVEGLFRVEEIDLSISDENQEFATLSLSEWNV